MSAFPPERVEPDVCLLCGLEEPGCVCTASLLEARAELEHARRSRLSAAELESEAKP